jgi:hypothetical protein
MEALSRGDLKLTGKLPEPHRYLFLHLSHIRTTNPFHIHLQAHACASRTEFVPSHLNFVALLLINMTIRLFFFPTHSPLGLTPLDIFITPYFQKPKPLKCVTTLVLRFRIL